eukprot:CAMPEP_0203958782 /NCGR_PEP_ID=MMETSP0359-20131031/90098_1 /ASSEMBLY_ACC=CAM_ASM_000338 /TAXON_ID=268821 /ORGANISM="Scrippsiella Hangoei, Strain SHTV-5" /LENGTH=33 /DNA_ID= /DNA_START= /DNA_END= /DNA_ORIENTATION=
MVHGDTLRSSLGVSARSFKYSLTSPRRFEAATS